jgi:hypothetical protein
MFIPGTADRMKPLRQRKFFLPGKDGKRKSSGAFFKAFRRGRAKEIH